MNDEQELLEALLVVKDKQIKGLLSSSKYGLCYQLSLILVNDLDYLIDALFRKWPKFSGHNAYPVPDPNQPDSLIAAKLIYSEGEFSKWSGAYGALRIELLDFLISELEKEIEPA